MGRPKKVYSIDNLTEKFMNTLRIVCRRGIIPLLCGIFVRKSA